jgi:hypothetical protein
VRALVQHIIRNSSDDDTRQLEETLAQSRRTHASRLQEELTRNRTDSADRLQLEIKVLRDEHVGLLEQKLAEIRLQHYQKVEEELESLRSQSAARLEQVLYVRYSRKLGWDLSKISRSASPTFKWNICSHTMGDFIFEKHPQANGAST